MNVLGTVNIEIDKEVVVDGQTIKRKYVFSMPIGAPYGEAADACIEAYSSIKSMSEQAMKQLTEKTEPLTN